jgi:beta-lactamase class A
MHKFLLTFLFVASVLSSRAQSIPALAAQAHGRVGVACSWPGEALPCSFHADEPLPMQSVYKLPIALVALHRVEAGKLRLDQTIPIRPSDIWSATTHSPLRDAHLTQASLRELLRYAVEQSDNIACDMLIRVLGGPAAVESALVAMDLPGIHIRHTEEDVSHAPRLQYTNTASASALLHVLVRLRDNSPVNPAHTALLLGWMTSSPTGPQRIKGLLPPGTPVAHKTGTGDDGLVNAINDIGLITLPDGRRLALAVLIADSHVPVEAREHVIAEVARTLYGAAQHPK